MQSPYIALGVDKKGADDQGIVYGYATDESFKLMPLPIVLARRVAIKMNELARHIPQFFGSDGKCQVSVEYNGNDEPVRVGTVVVS
jgi:S-adenosylmethionine synthetase